jgi:hypothetical protein
VNPSSVAAENTLTWTLSRHRIEKCRSPIGDGSESVKGSGVKKTKLPSLEYRSLKRKAMEFDRAARREKAQLMQWAQAGSPTALALLRTRYRLRLPLVEAAKSAR